MLGGVALSSGSRAMGGGRGHCDAWALGFLTGVGIDVSDGRGHWDSFVSQSVGLDFCTLLANALF